jgi:uncharacterized membrane protein
MTLDEKINLIGQKIGILSNNLDQYKQELDQLKFQLNTLISERNALSKKDKPIEPVIEKPVVPVLEIKPPVDDQPKPVEEVMPPLVEAIQQPVNTTFQQPLPKIPKISFEEKVGSKWLSIVGIVILVLGIAIGVKYAIDEDLINETTRLVLGYLAGMIILSCAVVYKKKYELFSAILLSGAMAVMYFTTFAGYSFYHFYTAPVAFSIMTLFTGFTVYAAHVYNKEVIALVGLVGGYAIPPLLSTGSGEIQYMFGFMLILNSGILVLSFLKYWRFVNHVAYCLTWLIFASWMASSYNAETYLGRTMFFATAFYLIFYASFVSYKIIRNKAFSPWDVILVLTNSFIYFGIGYGALQTIEYEQYQGLFCVANALFHLGFALYCKQKNIGDRTLFHFIIAMIITFLTIAIPVQLNGNYVTLTWLSEIIILLWMTKQYGEDTYRKLAYGIGILAFCSLIHDWVEYADITRYANEYGFKPVLNEYFLTGLLGIAAYFFAWKMNRSLISDLLSKAANVAFLVMFILVAYITFGNEINLYFDIQYYNSGKKVMGDYGYDYMNYDYSWRTYSSLWMFMFTAVFVSILNFLNLSRLKNVKMAWIGWGFNILIYALCITGGFVMLNDLLTAAVYYDVTNDLTTWNYNFRYVFLPAVLILIGMVYKFRDSELLPKLRPVNTWLFHIFILIVLSNELYHILTVSHLDDFTRYEKVARRMGFTILWGLYSMFLIIYGIIRKKRSLRIIALSLFGLTLIKLAIDALSMTRGYQLIVFISIGIILLIVSFMYQKFKPLLFGDEAESKIEEPKTDQQS